MRWRSRILIFQFQLGMSHWIMNLPVFCNQITTIRKWRIYIYIYCCSVPRGTTGTCFMSGDGITIWMLLWFSISPYHAQLRMGIFVLLYYDDTVDVHYNKQVDNIISLVIQNNHLWNLMLLENDNIFLRYFHLITVIDDL